MPLKFIFYNFPIGSIEHEALSDRLKHARIYKPRILYARAIPATEPAQVWHDGLNYWTDTGLRLWPWVEYAGQPGRGYYLAGATGSIKPAPHTERPTIKRKLKKPASLAETAARYFIKNHETISRATAAGLHGVSVPALTKALQRLVDPELLRAMDQRGRARATIPGPAMTPKRRANIAAADVAKRGVTIGQAAAWRGVSADEVRAAVRYLYPTIARRILAAD